MSSQSERRGSGGSIRFKLFSLAVTWCLASVVIAAVVLIWLFERHVARQVESELYSHVTQLAALTEPDGRGSYLLREQMASPLYSRPFSSWVWQIRRDGVVLLQSRSLGPLNATSVTVLTAPSGSVGYFKGPMDQQLTGLSRQISPRFSNERLTFVVARPSNEVQAAIAQFRNSVVLVLALFAIGQVATAALLVSTGLEPLTRLRRWVVALRKGEAISDNLRWPKEIQPVVQEIEELENHVERLITRARGQAADLAHSIKTPLSVLHQIGETHSGPDAELLRRQNARIDAALQRHLAHVRASGRGRARISIQEVVEDLSLALEKTLSLKEIPLKLNLARDAAVTCDENDIYEIIGNLMDNASKWAKSQIQVTSTVKDGMVCICVDDDGPGIFEEDASEILKRGHRLDQRQPGQGLGLSIVSDLLDAYSGSLQVERSPIGGARIKVVLPEAHSQSGEA